MKDNTRKSHTLEAIRKEKEPIFGGEGYMDGRGEISHKTVIVGYKEKGTVQERAAQKRIKHHCVNCGKGIPHKAWSQVKNKKEPRCRTCFNKHRFGKETKK